MSTEQPWGSERWSGRKTAAAIAIALVIAAGGGAAIWAATADDSGTAQRPGGGPGGPGGAGGPGSGRFFGMGALDAALHGEFVVAGGTTELLQTGKVTEISATSVGLTSTDGYAKSYTIDASTLIDSGVKIGDEVTVIAKKSDNVAVSVVDRTHGAGRRGGQPQQPPQPRP